MCPHESSDAVPPDADSVSAVLRAELPREEGLNFAYLFGSLAKGRPRRMSDVDVAVHLSEDAPDARTPGRRLDRALEIEGRLERALGRAVQVVVLNDAPLELRFNVLSHGLLLHAADHATRRRFYVETGRRYYDMAPARAMFRRRQRERIREGRFGG